MGTVTGTIGGFHLDTEQLGIQRVEVVGVLLVLHFHIGVELEQCWLPP